jgi:hypothetical protein
MLILMTDQTLTYLIFYVNKKIEKYLLEGVRDDEFWMVSPGLGNQSSCNMYPWLPHHFFHAPRQPKKWKHSVFVSPGRDSWTMMSIKTFHYYYNPARNKWKFINKTQYTRLFNSDHFHIKTLINVNRGLVKISMQFVLLIG